MFGALYAKCPYDVVICMRSVCGRGGRTGPQWCCLLAGPPVLITSIRHIFAFASQCTAGLVAKGMLIPTRLNGPFSGVADTACTIAEFCFQPGFVSTTSN